MLSLKIHLPLFQLFLPPPQVWIPLDNLLHKRIVYRPKKPLSRKIDNSNGHALHDLY